MNQSKGEECDLCKKVFRCNNEFRRHRINVHKLYKLEKVGCDECGKKLTEKSLLNHKRTFHEVGSLVLVTTHRRNK